jgi:hypothetical protein
MSRFVPVAVKGAGGVASFLCVGAGGGVDGDLGASVGDSQQHEEQS